MQFCRSDKIQIARHQYRDALERIGGTAGCWAVRSFCFVRVPCAVAGQVEPEETKAFFGGRGGTLQRAIHIPRRNLSAFRIYACCIQMFWPATCAKPPTVVAVSSKRKHLRAKSTDSWSPPGTCRGSQYSKACVMAPSTQAPSIQINSKTVAHFLPR